MAIHRVLCLFLVYALMASLCQADLLSSSLDDQSPFSVIAKKKGIHIYIETADFTATQPLEQRRKIERDEAQKELRQFRLVYDLMNLLKEDKGPPDLPAALKLIIPDATFTQPQKAVLRISELHQKQSALLDTPVETPAFAGLIHDFFSHVSAPGTKVVHDTTLVCSGFMIVPREYKVDQPSFKGTLRGLLENLCERDGPSTSYAVKILPAQIQVRFFGR